MGARASPILSRITDKFIVDDVSGDAEAADAARDKLRRWNPVLLVKLDVANAELRKLQLIRRTVCIGVAERYIASGYMTKGLTIVSTDHVRR